VKQYDVPEFTDLSNAVVKLAVAPGNGWASARGAAPGTRTPRAGHYQVRKHAAVAAGWEPGSDEDDDATELPLFHAMLRTDRHPLPSPAKPKSTPPSPDRTHTLLVLALILSNDMTVCIKW
jgi:hypothetical protein